MKLLDTHKSLNISYRKMKRISYLLFLIVIQHAFLFCHKNENSDNIIEKRMCNVTDPLTELNWLVEEMESIIANNRSTEIYFCNYKTI